MVFINITMFIAPASRNAGGHGGARLGSTPKALSYLDQLVCLVASIRRHWKSIKYDFNVYHSVALPVAWVARLREIDVNVVQVEPDHPERPWFCLGRTFDAPTRRKGTHRLSLDLDMLALDEFPKLDFDVDAYFAYERLCPDMQQALPFLCSKMGIPCPAPRPHADYNIPPANYKAYALNMNNGAQLLRERICPQFGALVRRSAIFYGNEGWAGWRGRLPPEHKHIASQYSMGAMIEAITANWRPFPHGFNVQEKSGGARPGTTLSLYHYSGTGSSERAMKKYPDYFAVSPGGRSST